MSRVIVVDYDPSWVADFERLRTGVSEAVGPLAISIEHVGSTSVPGLAAKPVIDIDIVVATDQVAAAIARLAGIGYRHLGESGPGQSPRSARRSARRSQPGRGIRRPQEASGGRVLRRHRWLRRGQVDLPSWDSPAGRLHRREPVRYRGDEPQAQVAEPGVIRRTSVRLWAC